MTLIYDGAGRRSTLTLPNGIVTTYGYDDGNQLTSLTYTLGETTLGTLTYTYDAGGRRTAVGGTWARTGLPQPMAGASYDAANRVQAWAGQIFSFDANSNLASDGLTSYTWDVRDQLVGLSGETSASFAYDAEGRRRSKTINGTSTNFLYDGVNLVQELSGTTPTATLLIGRVTDETFSRSDAGGTSTLLVDALGSTLELADGTGTLQTHHTFDPFGATTTSGAASSNTQHFTGRENDGVGVYYYRSRFYMPQFGRFISEDAPDHTDSIDLYTFVRNNPINFVDPFGYFSCAHLTVYGNLGYISIQTDPVSSTLAWGAYMYMPMWNWGDWWTEEVHKWQKSQREASELPATR